jgi:hypothetical protein
MVANALVVYGLLAPWNESGRAGRASGFSTGLLVDAAGQKASVDDQSLSGNEGSSIGCEVDGSSHEFFVPAEAPHRRPCQQFMSARRVVEQVCIHGSVEDAGRDGVHCYPLF